MLEAPYKRWQREEAEEDEPMAGDAYALLYLHIWTNGMVVTMVAVLVDTDGGVV